jgi:hypothetical protein
MRILPLFFGLLYSGSLAAQDDYQPPDLDEGSTRPFQLGLYGFAVRAGVDFEGQGQAVASFALDMGDLYTDRLRLRPSAELGFGWGDNTYVANAEVVYRFTADTAVAVPYIGGGAALSGQEGCGLIDDCPRFWAQFVLGFELRLRHQINWLLEYHAEDAFKRHRIFVGLTTRRGR